jgi:hypothetical protein
MRRESAQKTREFPAHLGTDRLRAAARESGWVDLRRGRRVLEGWRKLGGATVAHHTENLCVRRWPRAYGGFLGQATAEQPVVHARRQLEAERREARGEGELVARKPGGTTTRPRGAARVPQAQPRTLRVIMAGC